MRVLVPLIGAVFFACATAPLRVPFDVSAPTVIPDGVLGRIDADGSTTLYMEGWDLKIAVQNQRSYVRGSGWDLSVVLFPLPLIIPTIKEDVNPPEDQELSPLVVILRFDSREEGLLFSPDSVRVDPEDGPIQSMEAFKGPAYGTCGGVWLESDRSPVPTSDLTRCQVWTAPRRADLAGRTDPIRRPPLRQIQGS